MRQLRNPFYVLLMVTGVIFTITMCAYMVMTLQLGHQGGRNEPAQGSLVDILQNHGLTMIIVEIVVLAVCTVAAIATDEYWTGESAENKDENITP